MSNDWVRDNPLFRDERQKSWLRTLIMRYYAPKDVYKRQPLHG